MTAKELRSRAEHLVRLTRREVGALSSQDVQRIVYELQIHQVELEMQNESLRGAQHAVEDSYAQYQELFDCAPVGYVLMDASNRVIRANAAALTILGVTLPELVGQQLHAFVTPEDLLSLDMKLRGAQEAHTSCEVGLRSPARNAVHVRLDIAFTPSRSTQRLVALTDVSERKRSVEALERLNQELEARVESRTLELAVRNRQLEAEIAGRIESEKQRRELELRLGEARHFESLGVLAGGIAHDFNNLLTSVLGNAELMWLTVGLNDQWRGALSMIRRACHQASELTRQLLVFAGQGRLTTGATHLSAIVLENLELLRTRIPAGIDLQTQIDCAAPEIEADRSQVGQVVMNLVTNALEALDDHGTISVQVRVEQLDSDRLATFQHHQTAQPGSFVVFQVRDSGPGIEPIMMARIFEPFFSTKFAGRGLGLASVLGIMHSHRGAVRVQSELGTGASFEVAFPVTARPRTTVPPPDPVQQPWRGSGSVLLVDDDDGVRTVVAKLLKELGFDVTTAEGGQVGLDLFVRGRDTFKLVVLDWIMPDFSGEQLLAAVHEIDPTVPVIVISGYGADELGCNAQNVICLQKPMTLARLRDSARRLLVAARAVTN